MQDEQRKRLVGRGIVLMLGVGFTGLAYGFWQSSNTKSEAIAPAPVQAAQPIFDPPPAEKPKMPTIVGRLAVSPETLQMGSITLGQGSYSGSFTLTARQRPIKVKTVSVNFAQESGIKLDAMNCVDKQLGADESCTVDVLFDPLNPRRIEKQVIISAESDNSDGSKRQIDMQVALIGEAVQPPPPPQAVAKVVEPTRVVVHEESRPNPALVAYLNNRQMLGGLNSGDVLVGPQKPESEDWSEIGQQRSMSTYPADLSHTLTMDKPIPAVVKIGIDTRYSNRAVAVVERDIYGGDGRLVIVPRGSVVTGLIRSSGSSGEEKVQMSFTRLVRPDGAAFAIQAYAGDAMGRPGVPAYIDRRYAERFGLSALATAANIGATIGLGGNQSVATTGSGVVASQDANSVATQQLNAYAQTVTGQLDKEGQQIAPIRSVPPGTRITVFPSTDLFLKPITPTEQMRQQILAKRRDRQEQEAGFRREAFKEEALLNGAIGPNGLPVTNAVPGVTQQSASQTQVTYDPITGQPVVRAGSTTTTTARPNVDRTGFPILPGNLGLQTPAGGPLSAEVGANSPLLNGTDASGSELIKEKQQINADRAAAAGYPPVGSYGGAYGNASRGYGPVVPQSVNTINQGLPVTPW